MTPPAGPATTLDRWQLCSTPAGRCADPTALAAAAPHWWPAQVPGTVASSLRAAGEFSLDGAARNFDADDWWYRCEFPAAPARRRTDARLVFEGLATLAEVWLNGERIATSDNMFLPVSAEVGGVLREDNELLIRFRSLDAHLATLRGRPAWRTPMVAHQQLRAVRTTLLGRLPGWSPPVAPVGPWRAVRLECSPSGEGVRLRTHVRDGAGVVEVTSGATIGGEAVVRASLTLVRGGATHTAALTADEGTKGLRATLAIDRPALWWPHTHGDPALYEARLTADTGSGRRVEVDLGRVGFRSVTVEDPAGAFRVLVNGVPVFCRGASWTPPDPVSLDFGGAGGRRLLERCREAGLNMLRVAGPFVYEDRGFYAGCDELGILIWQDLMFANMAYPETDAFVASARAEVAHQAGRLARHPSLAILCGNSEAAQQAAMWGVASGAWVGRLFGEVLRDVCVREAPGVPYVPSSAWGGDFPHQSSAGPSSYYGVGAYRRPVADARRAEVRFASESLGFAHVPEPEAMAAMPGGASVRCHDPRWKARVPRDLGAGWDFDDVRDHYFAEIFRVAPLDVRYQDHERYLALSRVVTGEVIAATFAEWRRAGSACSGALLWFLKDLWAGPGWGLLDSGGEPKAAFHYLARVCQPVALLITDEGTNGLRIHAVNDRGAPLESRLELRAFRAGQHLVAQGTTTLSLAPHSVCAIGATTLLPGFLDVNHAYRFGPPTADVVAARLCAADGAVLAEAFALPLGLAASSRGDVGLSATARRDADGGITLACASRCFAQAVRIEVEGFRPLDQYFHLAPGLVRTVKLLPRESGPPPPWRGLLSALNSDVPARIDEPAA